MRLIVLIPVILVIVFTSATCFAAPPGFDLLLVDSKSGDQLWYNPLSIQVFEDYVSVETYFEMRRPTQGGKYSLNTFYLKLDEKKYKVATATLYDATDVKLVKQFGSQWYDIAASLACEKLSAAIRRHIQSSGTPPRTTPAIAPPDLRYLPVAEQDDYYFYNPASLQNKEGYLAIQTVVEYYRSAGTTKYQVATIWLRLADSHYKATNQTRYNEAVEPTGSKPDDYAFRPIRPGSVQEALLAKVLDYCRDNNIQVQ